MKMNLKTFFCVLLIVELYYVQSIDGKRSFGITGRRNKSKSPSVRRGQHGHDGDDIPVPKPQPPDRKSGWNTHNTHSTNTHQQSHVPSAPPLGPQMPQTNNKGIYGSHNVAPPAYGSHGSYGSHGNYGPPPAYSAHGSGYGGYGAPPSYSQSMYGHQPGMYGGGQSPMGSPFMGSAPMMGVPMMGAMPAYQQRGSSFGSGIMTNLFAGLAGYQLAKAFSGGSGHRDHTVIIHDNRQVQGTNTNSNDNGNIQQQSPIQQSPVGPNASQTPDAFGSSAGHDSKSTQNPSNPIEQPNVETNNSQQIQFVPASNEYNYWGLPQYGIPLYGFNLPSQITDYYKVETFNPQ